MLMKVRNFGFVLIAAILGATGFSLRSKYQLVDIPIGSFIVFFGALIWGLIFFLEAKWYTPMLIGAVNTGKDIEEIIKSEFNTELPPLTENFLLSNSIKKTSSNVYLFSKSKKIKIDSQKRSRIFHWTFIGLLLTLSLAIALSADAITTTSAPSKATTAPMIEHTPGLEASKLDEYHRPRQEKSDSPMDVNPVDDESTGARQKEMDE